MGLYFALAFLLITVSFTNASFEDEMSALEKDIMNDNSRTEVKKSIKDLSTEELIAELEKEFSTKKDIDAKKYRQRFESIINRKTSLDELKNVDAKELFKDEIVTKDKGFPYDDLLEVLEKGYNNKNSKRSDDDTCKDTRTDCKSLESYCGTHRQKLEKMCAETCKYCVKCSQKMDANTCNYLKRNGQCKSKDPVKKSRMAILCGQTCGFCKVPSPPKCSKTTHGCCWDKTTIKSDAAGSKCPKCYDHYKYVCTTFKDDCRSFMDAGTFMRSKCPKTCAMCAGKCADNPEKKALCPFWKRDLKWCENNKSVMQFYCPITCSFC